MLVFAAVVVRVLALASKGTCPSTNPGVCYPHSMPIIKTLHDVDPADCCTACKLYFNKQVVELVVVLFFGSSTLQMP